MANWQEARHLLTFARMKWSHTITAAALRCLLCLGLALTPMLLTAQKGKLKDDAQSGKPAVPGGKGAIKAVQHDTLVGGDGFIPRTVIDSFPAQPVDSAVALRPGTSVRRDDLDASKARIAAMKLRVKEVDSALVVYRQDTTGTWTEARLHAIDSLLADSKAWIGLAEQELANLEARWEAKRAPAPEPEAASTPAQPTPSKEKPKENPSEKPATDPKPAPAPQPGVPAAPSGKGKIKEGGEG